MKDVLICCTDAEGSQLEWLAKALLDTGWSVNFMHKGSRGVASADCVIAVWSPRSVGDAWLTARATTAAKHRRLVSIRLGGARPPRGLRSEQVIDLSEWPARGADRAINSLLGSVDAVANGVVQRVDSAEGSKLWIGLGLALLVVGGGYALFKLASVQTTGGATANTDSTYSAASIRAADEAAAAEHAMRGASAASNDRPNSDAGTTTGDGQPAVKPAAEMSDAARIGAQALSQLSAQIEAPDGRIDAVRSSAEEALALDPQQPHARATLAVVTGLADLNWREAAAHVDTLDATSSDAALAGVIGRYLRLIGQSAQPVASDPPASPLCSIPDDIVFAQAIIDLSGAERLSLLKYGCVVERIGSRPDVRTKLGITQHD